MADNFYRVDDLLIKEGVYKEDMSKEEVIELLENGMLKYLGDKVFKADENKKHLYNTACKKITMGTLKGFSITHMCKLASAVSSFCSTNQDKEYGSYFTEISNWDLNDPLKATEITVDLTFGNTQKVAVYLTKTAYSSIAKLILTEINNVNPNLLDGDGYASIKFITSSGAQKNLGSDLILKLSKALVKIKDTYPKFEFYCGSSYGKAINAHMWAINTYKLADVALKNYIIERREMRLTLDGTADEYSKELLCTRRSIMKTYLEKKNIKRGDMVFFSVIPVSKACPCTKIHHAYIRGDEATDTEVTGESRIRSLTCDSFFLAKIAQITEEFLVLKIKYGKSGSDSYINLPIAWNILLPNLKDGYLRLSTAEKGNNTFKSYINTTSDDALFRELKAVPVLLTEADCYTLSHPSFTLSMSGF